MSLIPPECGKSDLYAWREIFRLYAEVQVFETVRESTQGERSIDDVERQLKLFEDLIKDQKASLVLPTSKDALDVFLSLNVFILDVKKVTEHPHSPNGAPTHASTPPIAPIRQLGGDAKDTQEARKAHDASHPLLSPGPRRVHIRALVTPTRVDHEPPETASKAPRAGTR